MDSKHLPIEAANILVNNGSTHTHSNELGVFMLDKVKVGDTLFISNIGFLSVSRIIESVDFDRALDIQLKETAYDLGQIVVSDPTESVHSIAQLDLLTQPIKNSQEILTKVPGLFIAQHAGGGKAEQIFLRGFDIDHGTDIQIGVDGMPVNMVSHAHGQGYADLHFLIPETIAGIDFGKGPYYADQGNFNTAGYVNFKTKDRLEESSIGLEVGAFNTFRAVGLFDLLDDQNKQSAYLATEFVQSDGPFESSQNFNRINIMGKYNLRLSEGQTLSLTASHFQSRWTASGQIPQRTVDAGLINRFGAIDDTEGGNTRRTNLALAYVKTVNPTTFLKSNVYFSNYDFELFSNFTFFLNDPVNGDQIRQSERRNLFGFQHALHHDFSLGELKVGVGLRYDDIKDNALERTLNRNTVLESIAFGNIQESNVFGFAEAHFDLGAITINPGVRFDYFRYSYENLLDPTNPFLANQANTVSPKLNLIYTPTKDWQFYIKSGIGFHSNDTRTAIDPSANLILPNAYGTDLGTIWKPTPRLWINSALWYLQLEQEFVYVGDEGIVEPSGRSRRMGVDLGMRYQMGDFLFLDGDVNYTYARSIDEPEGADYIPLAPDLTAKAGVSIRDFNGWNGGVQLNYIKDRPANEDGSIMAKGYTVMDLNLNYTIKNITIGGVIENLFDVDWNEAQFATESRLFDEVAPVEEIHFTPGVPFSFTGKVQFRF